MRIKNTVLQVLCISVVVFLGAFACKSTPVAGGSQIVSDEVGGLRGENCELLEGPKRKYWLDPFDESYLLRNASLDNLIGELDHQQVHALFLWGKGAYQPIRLIQAYGVEKVDAVYNEGISDEKKIDFMGYEKLVKNFNSAINKLLDPQNPSKIVLYRGIKGVTSDLARCWEKKIDQTEGYIMLGSGGHSGTASTTSSLEVAERFGRGPGAAILYIETKSAVDISRYTLKNEKEFLIPEGVKFRVVQIEGNRIILREVGL